MIQMQPSLLVILGPTGVGKTDLCLDLAKRLGVPIISADSRQLYKGLSIGTAAPTPDQLSQVQHYMVGTLNINEYFNAGRYENEVIDLLKKLHTSTSSVILTGGSMMYIDAVCNGIDDLPNIDDATRNAVISDWKTKGLDFLCEELLARDPEYYRQVDLKNPKRVMHAIELCRLTGEPYSMLRTNTVKQRPFKIIKIGLNRPREELYERINKRVDAMMEAGLEQEARLHYHLKEYNALNTVGYKELFAYIDGKLTLQEAVEKIKQNSRIYSRKQMTWFKRDTQTVWFHPDETEKIITYITNTLQNE